MWQRHDNVKYDWLRHNISWDEHFEYSMFQNFFSGQTVNETCQNGGTVAEKVNTVGIQSNARTSNTLVADTERAVTTWIIVGVLTCLPYCR